MIRYLITVSICWVALYAIYHLFLRRETFFGINRAYLLGSLVLGAAIPAYQWLPSEWWQSHEVVATYVMSVYEMQYAPVAVEATTWSWLDAVMMLYWLGAALVLLRFLHGLYSIYSLRRAGRVEAVGGVTLVHTQQPHLPFSFGRTVYLSEQVELDIDIRQLLRHEEVHIKEWHTIDVLFVEVMRVFFWFNPILILYKKALQQAHEYVADAMVIKDTSRKSYGQLLLRQCQSGMEIALANHFFHSQIKKRIQMMYQKESRRSAMVKYLSAIPVLAVLVVCFSAYYPGNADDLEERLYEIVTADMSEDDRAYKLLGLVKEHEAKGADMEEVISVMSDYGVDVTPDSEGDSYSLCRYYDQTEAKIEEVHLARGIIADTLRTNTIIMIDGDVFDGELEDLPSGTIHYTTTVRGEEASRKYGVPPNSEVIEVKLADRDKQVTIGDSYLTFERKSIVMVTKGQDPMIIRNELNRYSALVIDNKVVSLDRPIKMTDLPTDLSGYKIIGADQAQSIWGDIAQYGALVVQTDSGVLPDIHVVGYGQKSNQSSPNKVTTSTIDEQDGEVYKRVEIMPAFPGCQDLDRRSEEFESCSQQSMLEYIYSNVKYPAAARDAGEEGMIVVQFVVDAAGKVSTSKLVRDVGTHGLGDAAMAVVDQMRSEITWLPGMQDGKSVSVLHTLPIRFKLASGKSEQASDKPKPLVFLDGKRYDGEMDDIDPESIASVNVVKGDKAIAKYGADAANGVVEIVTKSSSENGPAQEAGMSISAPKIKIESEDKKIQLPDGADRIDMGDMDPIIYLDGVRYEGEVDDIDPESIASINVYKGEKAMAKYGTEATVGVVEIVTKSSDSEASDKIYNKVDVVPAFPGCEGIERSSPEFESCSEQKMLEYVYSNVKYPAAAREAGEEGMTVVQFVIDAKGKVADAKIVREVGTHGLGDAAMAVVDQMRSEITWLPGMQDDKAVSVLYTLPIRFKLADTDIAPASISVRPNPAQGAFTIDLTGITGEVEVSVTDLAGRTLYNRTYSIEDGKTSVEVESDQFTGIAAIATVRSGDKSYSQQIIFE